MSSNKAAKHIVVVGGVAAGMSFAARYRRLNENDTITVLEQGEHVSFANCGLPYYIGGVIEERAALLLQTAKGFKDRFNIDVYTKHQVTVINPTEKSITVCNLNNHSCKSMAYDKLILCNGAKPFIPPIKGIEEVQNIYTLRNIADVDHIKEAVKHLPNKVAAVLGGGFIGLEMAENLSKAGFKVHLIEASAQLLASVDPEMAHYVSLELQKNGIHLYLNSRAECFDGHIIHLSSGKQLEVSLIIAAMGVRPDSTLAKEAGLPLAANGAIVVDDQFKVCDDIYAIGDVIASKSFINQHEGYWPLANPANRQGRLLADILNGSPKSYPGIIGVAIAKVFGLSIGSAGLNQHQLDQASIGYQVVHGHSPNHASYYPGAQTMHYKLLFGAEGVILGAQIAGGEGVDKRLDIIATAIKGHLTVFDLIELETAYAPPYGSAKDAIIMAAYAATNILDGLVKNVAVEQLDGLIAQGARLLDVRSESERSPGNFIKGALWIPLPALRSRLGELPRNQPLYIHCQSGIRSYNACRMLSQMGYDCYNIDGGFSSYATMNERVQ